MNQEEDRQWKLVHESLRVLFGVLTSADFVEDSLFHHPQYNRGLNLYDVKVHHKVLHCSAFQNMLSSIGKILNCPNT